MSGGLRIVIFGLSLSSSWGNGHATTWRALVKALAARGHDVLFLERDRPWYAAHRDFTETDCCELILYDSLEALLPHGVRIAGADAVIIGSFVPDGITVGGWVQNIAQGTVAFYDIDTPVTLAQLADGSCGYLTPELIPGYDYYFSFSGGPVPGKIERRYRAPRAVPLYCSVDTERYVPTGARLRWDLGYIGTYSIDRQPALERLLLEPARAAPELRFVVAGAQYPKIDWPANVERIEHVPPHAHPEFYSACRFSLNLTRQDMASAGYSPSVRLFEAAACGSPIISDRWPGLRDLFEPEKEILIAEGTHHIIGILFALPEADRLRIAQAARVRVLSEHGAGRRAEELEALLVGEPTIPKLERRRAP